MKEKNAKGVEKGFHMKPQLLHKKKYTLCLIRYIMLNFSYTD